MARPLVGAGRRGRDIARVELIEDRGEAAVGHHFFRSREFLEAEGVSHTLLVSDRASSAAVPLVVREIPGTPRRDAISPYSYPGAKVSGEPLDPGAIDLTPADLVSVFVRDRLGDPPAFAGGTDRSIVLISDPAAERKSRMSDRQQIRKNEAAGYLPRVIEGPASTTADRDAFLAVYTETMHAVSAAAHYFFDADYFETLLRSPQSWLVELTGPEGDVAASALAVRSDGFLHYYLSGTADAHRRRAPSKNLIVATNDLADDLGLPLNLGGGLTSGDGLEEFKRGFANRELPFRTHEIVADPDAYEELSAGRDTAADAGFFPLYRAPV